jgi:hypothetical protein
MTVVGAVDTVHLPARVTHAEKSPSHIEDRGRLFSERN